MRNAPGVLCSGTPPAARLVLVAVLDHMIHRVVLAAMLAGPASPKTHPPDLSPAEFLKQNVLTAAAKSANPDQPKVNAAMTGPYAHEWARALQAEIDQLRKYGTFRVVPVPPGVRPTPCKWVLTTKRDADGNMQKRKARLVFRGDLQHADEYDDTFAPTGTLDAVRLFFALVCALDLDWLQLDVSGAFLNGNLKQNVYMALPKHSDNAIPEAQPGTCLKLLKTLYGLRQAPHEWRAVLNAHLVNLGLVSSEPDTTIYVLHNDRGFLLVKVWVDDMLFAGTGWNIIEPIVQGVKDQWDVHDVGKPAQFIGLKITRDRARGLLTLSQPKYIKHVLQQTGFRKLQWRRGSHGP